MLCCFALFVCLTLLASFFFPSHLSFKNMFIRALMKSNLGMTKRFCDTVRYIDDLLGLNNTKYEEEIVNIYPPELTLKRTSQTCPTWMFRSVYTRAST